MTTYFTATHNGLTFARSTTSRAYTHVAVIIGDDGKTARAFGWIGRPDLIEAKKAEIRRYRITNEIVVLPAVEVDAKAGRAAQKVEAAELAAYWAARKAAAEAKAE